MNIEAKRKAADKAFGKKRYRKARNLYLNVIEVQPDEYHYLQLARCAYKISNYEEVKVFGQKVLQKNPNNVDVLLILAKAFLISGNLVEAEEKARKTIVAGDNSADSHAVLAYIKMNGGDIEGSEKTILEALVMDPYSSFAHTIYGAILRSQNRRKEALREFKLAFKSHQSVGTLVNFVTQLIGEHPKKFYGIWLILLITGGILMNGFVLLGLATYTTFLGWINFKNGVIKPAWLGFGFGCLFSVIGVLLVIR